MEIRRLGPTDAEGVRELAQRLAEASGSPARIEAWLADERNVAVAAFEEGQAIGLAYGYRLPRLDERPDGLLLYSIGVVERERLRGIGTQLVDAMRRHAPGRMWLLTNESNEAAMTLYERAGGARPHADDVLWTFASG